MRASEIWAQFALKLRHDTLVETDFCAETRSFLLPFLSGEGVQSRREKYADAPFTTFDGEDRKCVTLACADGEYRFDFYAEDDKWKLYFIECITLPVESIEPPYATFVPLPEQEAWIKAEREVSRTVYFYSKLRDLHGADEALTWFADGAGEFLCAKSWVPYYKDGKAFVAYCAWIESRINGERVSIDEFSDARCVLRFAGHLWFRVYNGAGHIKARISLDEYRALFEYIWTDRAYCAGWDIAFEYQGEETVLVFT